MNVLIKCEFTVCSAVKSSLSQPLDPVDFLNDMLQHIPIKRALL